MRAPKRLAGVAVAVAIALAGLLPASAAAACFSVTISDGGSYTGPYFSITGDYASLGSWDNVTSSFWVKAGATVDLYADPSYGGGWIHATGAQPNGSRWDAMPSGWNNAVSSIDTIVC